ncbi:MAG TPA: UDP-3-O-(3-hydroxymyristoyl)glucosamine N-acyltransferase [Bacteroidota bacterium]|nr:UDP-3-O-(3-hydroxymyristoyl)glucosamine N-acyltransferase [Bacteroidota bacterium]
MTVREIAALLDGDIVGNADEKILGIAKIEDAKAGDLTFISNPKYEKFLESTSASAVIVSRSMDVASSKKLPASVIQVADPYASFIIVLQEFSPRSALIPPGIHPTAVIDPTAVIGSNCSIGAHVVVGAQCVVGGHTTILPGTVIGHGVKIGEQCLIYSNVSIRESCVVGNRVIIQPGAVIGSDGFGFAPKKDGSYQKIPQLGNVVIEDDVEIGANTCVDRATMGETRIKRGTKLDNLIQIAHNVTVGEDVVIAANVGIAGSTKVGNKVMIGGNAAITGHITIADRVSIAGHAGVSKSLTIEGGTYFGYPAKEASRARRIEGALRQLPELLLTIRELEDRIQSIEKKIHELKGQKL